MVTSGRTAVSRSARTPDATDRRRLPAGGAGLRRRLATLAARAPAGRAIRTVPPARARPARRQRRQVAGCGSATWSVRREGTSLRARSPGRGLDRRGLELELTADELERQAGIRARV